jgi:hypothetical protein
LERQGIRGRPKFVYVFVFGAENDENEFFGALSFTAVNGNCIFGKISFSAERWFIFSVENESSKVDG